MLNAHCPLIILLVAKPTLWDRKVCRNAPCMFGHPICLDTPDICLDDHLYVLMMCGCPIHTQHKESMFCQTKGCPYVPIYLDAPYVWMHLLYVLMPPYVWTPPTFWMALLCLDAPCMFGNPLHVLMSPPCLDTPICLDGPIFLDAHLYVWILPYVWMSPSLFVDPICMDATICLDNPLYVWMPLIHLDTAICLDAHIQTHRGNPPHHLHKKTSLIHSEST